MLKNNYKINGLARDGLGLKRPNFKRAQFFYVQALHFFGLLRAGPVDPTRFDSSTAHDACVFDKALTTVNLNFLHPPQGMLYCLTIYDLLY